jgi:hypothetical protein
MEIWKTAIKAFVVILILLFIVILFTYFSVQTERENCARTIEQGINRSAIQTMELLVTASEQIRNHQPFKAFATIINAKQITETLTRSYPEEFVASIMQKESFTLRNQHLIGKLGLHPPEPNIFSPLVWAQLISLIRLLEEKSRTEAQKQIVEISQKQPIPVSLPELPNFPTPEIEFLRV